MKGLKLDGFTFKQNGGNLTINEFIKLLESVGLEVGGSIKQVNEQGKEIRPIRHKKIKILR